jgi:hypothetical protein
MKISSLILTLSFINQGYASNENINWAVIRTEREIVTAHEVREYIDHMLVTDNLQAALFKSTDQDYEKYQFNRDKLINDSFSSGLKKMAFIRLAQAIATKVTDRSFFKITKEEFKKLVDKKIKAMMDLKTLKDLRQEEARDRFIEKLKEVGFPHLASESNMSLYQRWVNRVRFQAREQFRESEALRFICSIGNCKEKSPIEILAQKKRFFNDAFLILSPRPESKISGKLANEFIFSNDFNFLRQQEDTENRVKRIYYLGKIKDQKVEFMAINDWDITGVLERVGYPYTDDFGRTSGLMLNYVLNGENGSLTVQLENWLFSEELERINDQKRQHVEEEATIQITSRRFTDPKGNSWVIMGISGNQRIEKAGLHSWVQEAFHTLNPKSNQREAVARDGGELFLEGIIGLGGEFSILEKPHVDIKLRGEALLIPTLGYSDRNRITVTSSLDANVYGKTRDYPLFFASLFGEYSLLINGQEESTIGGKVGIGGIYKNVYLQANLFVVRWNTDLDQKYERGASWTTGLSIGATFLGPREKKEFEFN